MMRENKRDKIKKLYSGQERRGWPFFGLSLLYSSGGAEDGARKTVRPEESSLAWMCDLKRAKGRGGRTETRIACWLLRLAL